MIKEECKKASIILCKLFDGDYEMVATIVTAEANNDYKTLQQMLLRVQGSIRILIDALNTLED